MKIEYNGEALEINYIDEGSGKTVLILHGWGTSVEVYRSIINVLSPHMRIIALDMPGFGKSDEPECAFDVCDYAAVVKLFLEKLKVDTLSVIGHSHGGRVSIFLAAEENSKIKYEKIILLDSAGIIAKKNFKTKMKIKTYKIGKAFLSISFIKKLFPDALESFKKKKGSADYSAASDIMRKSLVKCINRDMTPFMPKIKAPTLLIWGENDTATPVSDGEAMEKLIPNAGLVRIKNAGHYCFLDNPVLFRRVLYSFFKIEE